MHHFAGFVPLQYETMEPWELSRKRALPGGWVSASDLPRGPGGRALCRWCQLEVPAGRRTFCSNYCVHEWKLRSNPGYLRECVLARDRGICAACGIDTLAEYVRLKRMRRDKRELAIEAWGLKTLARRSLWDADHIVPVVEGGGECDLSNLRTLCLRCHRGATAALRLRLRATAAARPPGP